jgi:hypothetical protein
LASGEEEERVRIVPVGDEGAWVTGDRSSEVESPRGPKAQEMTANPSKGGEVQDTVVRLFRNMRRGVRRLKKAKNGETGSYTGT